MSGTIVEVGSAVSGFSVGQAVFGMLDYDRGAYAQFAVASPRELGHKPGALSHVAAAALPVAGLTAWQALFEFGKLRRGQRVLIHGGSGGVGHFAVQFAAWSGAIVAATCSGADLDFVRELGATTVIDYRAERFEEKIRDVDLVVDLVAGETRHRSWQTLKPGGALVSTLPAPKPDRTDVSGREVVVDADTGQLQAIANLVIDKHVAVAIDRMFPLSETHAAHAHLENGHGRGKIVLAVE